MLKTTFILYKEVLPMSGPLRYLRFAWGFGRTVPWYAFVYPLAAIGLVVLLKTSNAFQLLFLGNFLYGHSHGMVQLPLALSMNQRRKDCFRGCLLSALLTAAVTGGLIWLLLPTQFSWPCVFYPGIAYLTGCLSGIAAYGWTKTSMRVNLFLAIPLWLLFLFALPSESLFLYFSILPTLALSLIVLTFLQNLIQTVTVK